MNGFQKEKFFKKKKKKNRALNHDKGN